MGDYQHPTKAVLDWTIIPAGILGFFQAIPWPGIAAFLGSVYTALRIWEFFREKLKK